MKRLRLLIVTIVFWLFLLYNIERLSQPINISSTAYIFVAIVAALTILIPQLHRLSLWLTLGTPIVLFLTIKSWEGYRLWGTAIPLTVTELSFIALTSLLARQVNHSLGEFEQVMTDITIETIGKQTEPFATGQGEMYREVRRARTHQRPLSLMALGIDEETLQNPLPRIVSEAQQSMRKHLALAGIARVMDEELEDYHIIAKQNSHFIVLLPETDQKTMSTLKDRLHKAVAEQMGITLKTGMSSLSQDVITFERLVKEATDDMETAQQPTPSTISTVIRHRISS